MPNNVNVRVGVSGVKQGSTELDQLRDKFDKLQKQGAKGFAIGAGAAITSGALGLVSTAVASATDVMADAISKASDLNETMSKSSVVFKDNADEVSRWGDQAATSFGLSKQQAIEAAASFGDLFNKVGLGADKSVEMSEKIVGLAADLASFNNLAGGSAEALDKIKSGLAGESEPLRSVGVFLTEASVKAKAMQMGLGGANRELSEGEKIQARYALILEQTASAQGDFARTSDQLANRQRINQAELDNALAKLGGVLLPLVTDAAGYAADAIGRFTDALDLITGKQPATAQSLADTAIGLAKLTPLGWAVSTALDAIDNSSDGLSHLQAGAQQAESRFGGLYDKSTLAGQSILDMGNKAHDAAGKEREARDEAKRLSSALDDLTTSAYGAADAFGQQATDGDVLKGRLAELGKELADNKKQLHELEQIKHPTASQQRDIDILKGKLAETRGNIFSTRVALAKLDGTGLDSLLADLSKAQYRTDKLGDYAREALGYFQKLAYAEGKVTGYKGDPGFAPRAAGGPMAPYQTYTVGEYSGHQETVRMGSQGGQVYPGSSGGGWSGAPVVVNVNVSGVMTPAVAEQLRRELGPVLAPLFARN